MTNSIIVNSMCVVFGAYIAQEYPERIPNIKKSYNKFIIQYFKECDDKPK